MSLSDYWNDVAERERKVIERREARKAATRERNRKMREESGVDARHAARKAKRESFVPRRAFLDWQPPATHRLCKKCGENKLVAAFDNHNHVCNKCRNKTGMSLEERFAFQRARLFIVGITRAVWIEWEKDEATRRKKFDESERKRGWAEYRQWCKENHKAIKKAASERRKKVRNPNPLTKEERSAKMKAYWRAKGAAPELRKAERDRWRNYKKAMRGYGYTALGGRLNKNTVPNMLLQQECKCVYCKADLSEGYEVDHIIPISLGGCHEPWNLQLLCPSCNVAKGGKHPVDFEKSIQDNKK